MGVPKKATGKLCTDLSLLPILWTGCISKNWQALGWLWKGRDLLQLPQTNSAFSTTWSWGCCFLSAKTEGVRLAQNTVSSCWQPAPVCNAHLFCSGLGGKVILPWHYQWDGWCEQASRAVQEGAWPGSWHHPHSHSASSQGGARAAAAARGTKGRVQTDKPDWPRIFSVP